MSAALMWGQSLGSGQNGQEALTRKVVVREGRLADLGRIPRQCGGIGIVDIATGEDLVPVPGRVEEIDGSASRHTMAVGRDVDRNLVLSDQIPGVKQVVHRLEQERDVMKAARDRLQHEGDVMRRSEERRVGKGGGRTGRYRGWPS